MVYTMVSKRILLDMDGVLSDLMSGLHKAVGLDYSTKNYPYPKNKYEMFPEFEARMGNGFSRADTYKICSTREFWENLPLEPTADEMVKALSLQVGLDNVYICSFPMAGPETWAGKIAWIEKYYPVFSKRIILTNAPKHFFANEHTILIDDRNENCFDFANAGGSAFLIPQLWNHSHERFGTNWIPDLISFIKPELNETAE